MKLANFPFMIRLLRQSTIKFLMASISRILPASVGLLCWLDAQGQQMPQDYWALEGRKATGQFVSLTIGPDGLFYAGSNGGASISVFNTNFVLVRQFGPFTAIRGIVVSSQTNVFVVDSGEDKIKVFDAQGGSIREFGGSGTSDGQFRFRFPKSSPGGGIFQSDYCGTMATMDRQDRLYVTDTGNNRVQVFDSQGAFLRKWGGTSGLPESLVFPRSIVVLPSDRVWVWGSDNDFTGTRNIQAFDLNGSYLGSKDSGGGFAYNMALTPDSLVAVDANLFYLGINLMDSDLNVVFTRSGNIPGGPPGSFAPDGLPERIPEPSGNTHGHNYQGYTFDKFGDFYFTFVGHGVSPAGIYVLRRKFNEDYSLVRNGIPHPSIIRAVQRAGTTLIDIDYRVVDADSPTVQVAMLAFVDGGNSLGSLVKMSTFAEGTQANLGPGIPTNTDRRVTWNVATDWPVGFVNLQFEILAKDERGLLPFHFITVPVNGVNPAFTMSHQPVTDADLLSLWYWLIATNDSAISFVNGQVKGVGGAFDGQVLATGSSTTAAGRNFLFQRLNLRIPTSAEITRAQSGRYGFGSVSANSVVKLP